MASVGYQISENQLRKELVIESTIANRQVRLYIVLGVPPHYSFRPTTKKDVIGVRNFILLLFRIETNIKPLFVENCLDSDK